MSSTSNGHLDATTGREVVYCHACSHEWYRDEHGLTCPLCDGEVTEIIDPENDPREIDHHSSASTSPEITPFRYRSYNDDSDPEEADIEEHIGPHGFTFRRSTRDGPNQEGHHNPAVDPVMENFFNMIRGFGPTRSANGNLFARGPPGHEHDHGHNFGGQATYSRTFTNTSSGNTTHVTIVSGGPMPRGRAGAPPGDAQGDPFQAYAQSPPNRPQQPGGIRVTSISLVIGANSSPRIFSNVLRDIGPPGHAGNGGEGNPPDGPPAFARSLHDILSLINPANAMAGDAVYSQEALDRIITNLMEANPQSNAAPPATEQGLKDLERKTVDRTLLGPDGKTECSICIDDMEEGQTAVFLPCKHWFHEECVVLWLKEHNTCPICRSPIEKNGRNNNNNNSNAQGGSSSQDRPGPGGRAFSSSSSPGTGRSPWYSGSISPFPDPQRQNDGSGSTQQRPVQRSRPPSQSQSRLNQALRNLSSLQQERERTHERDRASASGFSYDTSNLQRRSSHSPTSPRVMGFSEAGARMRERSPSQSSRSSRTEQEQRRPPSNQGPISWLRDRFSGAGSGNGSPRDERRS